MENRLSRGERRLLALINTLFVLVPIIFFVLLCLTLRVRSAQDTALVYTVRLYPVRKELTFDIARGDRVLDSVQKCEIGEVLSFSRAPAVTEVYDRRTGRMQRATYPDHETITLTVRASASAVEGGYRIGPYLLYRGQKLHLRLPHLTATGFCTDIQAQALSS